MRGRSFWLTLVASALVAAAANWLAQSPIAQAQTCPARQSSPGFGAAGGSLFGRVAAQWDAYFAAKVDTNNGILCNPTILGTLSLSASVIINSLGYVPLSRTGSNATDPFYIDGLVGFGVPRTQAPTGQVEIRSTFEFPESISRPTFALGSEVGLALLMEDSGSAFKGYGGIRAKIINNNPSNDGAVVVYAAKAGSLISYGRFGSGGLCVAEGGVFCGTNSPPTDGFVSKGPQQVPPVAFASLPTCVAGLEGSRAAVSNSTTATPNAVIAGGGTNHVGAYCDATNWVVR